MTCSTCHSLTARIRVQNGQEGCSSCLGIPEGGGARLDGVLARQRVRMDALMHEGDVLTPTVWDKVSHKEVPNEEFIRRHADNAHNFLSAEQVARSHPGLARKIMGRGEGTELASGVGDSTKEAERLISTLQPA